MRNPEGRSRLRSETATPNEPRPTSGSGDAAPNRGAWYSKDRLRSAWDILRQLRDRAEYHHDGHDPDGADAKLVRDLAFLIARAEAERAADARRARQLVPWRSVAGGAKWLIMEGERYVAEVYEHEDMDTIIVAVNGAAIPRKQES